MIVNTKRNDELDRDALKGRETILSVFHTIVEENSGTEYGRRYGFKDIKTYEDYKRAVPLIEYEDVQEEVERMYQGEENVLTAYKVKHFLLTTGTTGLRKRIPETYRAFLQYNNTTDRLNDDVAGLKEGMRLLLPIFRTDIHGEPEKEVYLTAAYYRNVYEMGFLDPDRYVGGETMFFNTGQAEDFLYAKLYAGLLTEEIVSVESTFLYDQLMFFDYLEKNWQQVLSDIEKGQVGEGIRLPDDIKDTLKRLPRSEERIRDIEKICREGFDGIARRLWPSLHVSLGISGKGFQSEEQTLRRYLGDIPFCYYSYACSECNIGVPMALESYEYVLLPRCGFFEFRPFGKGEAGKEPVLACDVQVGEKYELIITNWSGLYRYCPNDIVEITDFYGELPVMKFLFRKDQLISIAGEKTDVSTLERAVLSLEEELSRNCREFCFAPDLSRLPGRYLCFIEDEAALPGDKADAGARLDRILMSLNADYEDLRRNLHQIDAPEVIFLGDGSMSKLRIKLKKTDGHRKPIRLIDGDSVRYLRSLEVKNEA